MDNTQLTTLITKLFEKAHLSAAIIDIQLCKGGGNNRIYKVETLDGSFAVKKYFKQPGDSRDRLATEFAFLTYAQQASPHFTPCPYSFDRESDLALYEFIKGEPLQTSDIHTNEMSQAIHFFRALNDPSLKQQASALPIASEACFSIQDHLNLISARIHGLQQIASDKPEELAAQKLIQDLNRSWQLLIQHIKQFSALNKLDINAPLSPASRCISPSDFGFHNALKTTDGSLRFLDFEYAGWDDPAKTTGDFFSQPAVHVASHYFDEFTTQIMQTFEAPNVLIQRAHLLRVAYQAKWCCIVLNIFLPVHLARRRFAQPDLNESELKKMQLVKAEHLIKKMELHHYG